MEWSDYDVRFFVDNRLIGRTVHEGSPGQGDTFREPFYLIVNLAVGGNWPASLANPAVDTSTWANQAQADMVIDWIRVYACVPDPRARNCIYEGTGLGD